MNKYSENKNVYFYNSDMDGELKLSSYMAWCSEIAGIQLDKRGITREQLLSESQVFLLSRVAVEIKKPVKYKDRCTLSTWESSIKVAQFIRGYSLEKDGEQLITSSSSWILVDPASRRIINPKEYKHECLFCDDDLPALKKIKRIDAEKTNVHIPVFSELDANGHISNTVYGDFLVNYAPKQFWGRKLKSANIAFVHEAKIENTIDIYTQVLDENSYYMAGKLDGDKTCFEAIAELREQ